MWVNCAYLEKIEILIRHLHSTEIKNIYVGSLNWLLRRNIFSVNHNIPPTKKIRFHVHQG